MVDLKADNFLLAFEDDSVIRQYANRQQRSSSVPLKEVDGHVVFKSQGDFGPLQKAIGRLKISDFGSAVLGVPSELYFHDIQPEGLEAPEVLLKAGWNCSADIWNLGVVVRRRTVSGNHPNVYSCGSFYKTSLSC